jgi:transcription termination factor NusB
MAQRSKARKEALDQLFQADLRKSEISLGVEGEVREYAAEILAGVKANNQALIEIFSA